MYVNSAFPILVEISNWATTYEFFIPERSALKTHMHKLMMNMQRGWLLCAWEHIQDCLQERKHTHKLTFNSQGSVGSKAHANTRVPAMMTCVQRVLKSLK